jgi:hypothetical protein
MTDHPPTALGLNGAHLGRRVRVIDGAQAFEGTLWEVRHEAVRVTHGTIASVTWDEYLGSVAVYLTIGRWSGQVGSDARVEVLP